MRRFGDRRDGKLIRDIDGMHYFMPLIYPNRTDCEAYVSMNIELDNVEKFIKEYNADKDENNRLSLFGVILAASFKLLHKREKLNRFYANSNMYLRNYINASFVVKKSMEDDGEETFAQIFAEKDDNLFTIQNKLNEQIRKCKNENDQTTDAMEIIKKIPGKKLIGALIRWLDKHGWLPDALVGTDPTRSSIFFTNLGSIGMDIGYHHLANWGTNSIFIEVGAKSYCNIVDKKGDTITKKVISLSFTIDERIADGYYYVKSLKILKKYIENPELLIDTFES